MPEYNEKQIQEFKEKDRRIVCQNALAHAVHIIAQNGPYDVPVTVDDVTAVASKLVDWVYQKASDNGSDNGSDIGSDNTRDTAPEMTPRMREVMDELHVAVLDAGLEYSKEALAKRVLAEFGKYPTRFESIETIVERLS